MKIKFLLSLATVVLCLGCAQTTIKENGKTVFHTQANASRLVYRSANGSSLEVENLNHSTPTRAGGSVVGTTAAGVLPIVTAVVTKGVL